MTPRDRARRLMLGIFLLAILLLIPWGWLFGWIRDAWGWFTSAWVSMPLWWALGIMVLLTIAAWWVGWLVENYSHNQCVREWEARNQQLELQIEIYRRRLYPQMYLEKEESTNE